MACTARNFAVYCLAFAGLANSAVACEQPTLADCPSWQLTVAYTADLLRNLRGGIRRGDGYLDNLDLTVDWNPDLRFDVGGLHLHAHAIHNNGRQFSGNLVGDSQGVSNIEAVKAWRIYELWADYRFGRKMPTSIRFGLYDFNLEFNQLDLSGLFNHASHGIGPEIALSGLNGPSIFPVPGLALRVRGATDRFYWQAAALDGVPGDPDRPERTDFTLNDQEGALLALEIGGAVAGFAKLALGAWGYTADFDSIDEVDSAGEPVRADGNNGVYLLAERAMWQSQQRSVSAFLRAGISATRFNPLSKFAGFGIVARGLWQARPGDEFGAAIAHAANSRRYRMLLSGSGAPADSAETAVELTWRAPVADWLVLQPNVQYVINPGTDPNLANVWVVGLRFQVSWDWQRPTAR